MNGDSCSLRWGVSLFSGAGIGDLGFRNAGVDFKVMCEKEADRAALARLNFQNVKFFLEIQSEMDMIINHINDEKNKFKEDIFLCSCTAPCQGMSKNGMGKILNNVRSGKRPILDPRNRLILPALKIIKKIDPMIVFFENVIEMRNTVILDEFGEYRRILDIIRSELYPRYTGRAYDIEMADYGIPQKRKRLITIYTRSDKIKRLFEDGTPLIPPATHSRFAKGGLKEWVSVWNAIKDFSPLDASCREKARDKSNPFHRVNVLDEKKYEWIKHTPTGRSAFDNQCINPECMYQLNPSHGTNKTQDGINRSNKDTPLYCVKCGSLLPRPYTVEKNGSIRLMSGYTSAYKRMDEDFPASTLTRNFSFPCSDNKIHPTQNRVLSIAEALKIQTISNFEYNWGPIKLNGSNKQASDTLIRKVIGESIPPMFTYMAGKYLWSLLSGNLYLATPGVTVQTNLSNIPLAPKFCE